MHFEMPLFTLLSNGRRRKNNGVITNMNKIPLIMACSKVALSHGFDFGCNSHITSLESLACIVMFLQPLFIPFVDANHLFVLGTIDSCKVPLLQPKPTLSSKAHFVTMAVAK